MLIFGKDYHQKQRPTLRTNFSKQLIRLKKRLLFTRFAISSLRLEAQYMKKRMKYGKIYLTFCLNSETPMKVDAALQIFNGLFSYLMEHLIKYKDDLMGIF
jgi:hypothetical protein